MIVRIDPASPIPPYEQLRAQVAASITAGQLPDGHRLPPIRQLAGDLGVAPGTVARAYRALEASGLVTAGGRRGTRVAAHLVRPVRPADPGRPAAGGPADRPPVSRLILLNGPPGAGKSTLARRYVDEHPLALNLDIDQVRSLLGRWRNEPATAGRLARALALAAAATHLAAGYDVVIPQLLAQPEFIDQVAQLARQSGAEFHEIVLLDTKENTLRRYAERSRAAAEPAHVDAAKLLAQNGEEPALSTMYDRLVRLIGSRPAAQVVRTRAGQTDRAYQDLLARLTTPTSSPPEAIATGSPRPSNPQTR